MLSGHESTDREGQITTAASLSLAGICMVQQLPKAAQAITSHMSSAFVPAKRSPNFRAARLFLTSAAANSGTSLCTWPHESF